MSLDTLCPVLSPHDAGVSLDTYAPAEPPEETYRCGHCGTEQPVVAVSHVTHTVGEASLSVRTYYRDDNAHEVYLTYVAGSGYPERTVCTDCRDRHYVYCEDQDGHYARGQCVESTNGQYVTHRYARSHWYYNENNERWYQDEDDYNESQREYADDDTESGCYTYGTNVIGVQGWPRATKKDELCFGVELECEPKSEDGSGQRAIAEALGGRDGDGRYILAEDGSLEYGVEIISLPYTLAKHSEGLWREISEKISDIAMSGSGTTRCGLHIHINRKPLSPLTVGKMLVFVNSPLTESLITTVAQRTGASWAKRHPKKFSDGRLQYSDHYEALGLTEHGTLELRIFRGNLRPERILKAIEFAHALVKFCQQSSMLDVENPKAFVGFIRSNKRTYPNLVAFIQESQGYGAKAAERATNAARRGTEA